ncbi:hypothetical protein FG87_31765 [Nocardia vulneris]|uniref:Uncharacterized protein n=1 Tax=Nocardia vulneris TaxID=1141657 RepID=A0ABR4Z8G0_9NOCA|nr:hypothetical protein FG87_31765 [Nocardia vulneris]
MQDLDKAAERVDEFVNFVAVQGRTGFCSGFRGEELPGSGVAFGLDLAGPAGDQLRVGARLERGAVVVEFAVVVGQGFPESGSGRDRCTVVCL